MFKKMEQDKINTTRRRRLFGGYNINLNRNINRNRNHNNNRNKNDNYNNNNLKLNDIKQEDFDIDNQDPDYKTNPYDQYPPFSPPTTSKPSKRRLSKELSPRQLRMYQEINDYSPDMQNKVKFMKLPPLINSTSANSYFQRDRNINTIPTSESSQLNVQQQQQQQQQHQRMNQQKLQKEQQQQQQQQRQQQQRQRSFIDEMAVEYNDLIDNKDNDDQGTILDNNKSSEIPRYIQSSTLNDQQIADNQQRYHRYLKFIRSDQRDTNFSNIDIKSKNIKPRHPIYDIINPEKNYNINDDDQQQKINDLILQNAILKNELKKRDEEKKQIEIKKRRRRPQFKSPRFSHGPPQKPDQNDNQLYLNYIQVKLQQLDNMYQVQVFSDIGNESGTYQQKLDELNNIITQPSIRNNPKLINDIRSTILLDNKNYNDQEIIDFAQDEIDNHINNNRNVIFHRINQQHELPSHINILNNLSAIISFNADPKNQELLLKKLSSRTKVTETFKSVFHLLRRDYIIQRLNRSGTARNNNKFDNLICPGILLLFLPENALKLIVVQCDIIIEGGTFNPRH